jgi:hypothetical protein
MPFRLLDEMHVIHVGSFSRLLAKSSDEMIRGESKRHGDTPPDPVVFRSSLRG